MARFIYSSSDDDRARHPHLRRQTERYKRKKRLVRDLWLISGVVMLHLPVNMILALALATTFLSFTILDETQ